MRSQGLVNCATLDSGTQTVYFAPPNQAVTDKMSFKNKVVIVTGAGSGMGAATALLFAEEGAKVVIVDKSSERAFTTAGQCQDLGIEVVIVIADVSKRHDNEQIIRKAIDHFGSIDILVNIAGAIKEGKILDGTILSSYDEIMDTNLRSVVTLTSLAAPHLAKTKGCIVNMSSVGSTEIRTGFLFPAYCVSKAAVDCFTRASAFELASSGVRVNAVNPGPVHTNFLVHGGVSGSFDECAKVTALKKASDPKEVANLILYLASDKASSITGACYVIDNGMALV